MSLQSQNAPMGIADRNWYREELRKRESQWQHPLATGSSRSRPPESLWKTTGAVVLVGAVIASAMLHAQRQERKPSPPHTAVVSPVVIDPFKDDPTWHGGPRPVADPQAYVPPTETREVYKCMLGGRPTYSGQSNCRGVSMAVPIHAGPSAEEVAEAQNRADALSQPAAAIDQRFRTAQPQGIATGNMQSAAAGNASACVALDGEVAALDAQARQPQGASTQGWLKDRRADARSRQFALHC
ncbi:MAG: hypothetical protein ABI330_11690 [Caldimonas sp.]